MIKHINQNKLQTFIAIIFCLGVLNSAQAQEQSLPLVSETAGKIQYGTLTLYRDSKNPKKVYYFPNSSRFSVDKRGIPLFNFVHWGLNDPNSPDKGAYFSMTTQVASDAEQEAALNKYRKANPSFEVAVIPVKSSTVGLTTTRQGEQPLSKLFEEYNFSKLGGRAEDDIGINAVLTPVGARAFKALLTNINGGSPIKFDYCYRFEGLGPNMHAKITVNMKRVYELFSVGHSGGWGWFSWNIQRTVEKLHADRAIAIQMDGGNATEWEYLKTIAETITKRMFVPELAAGGTIGEADSNRAFRFTGGGIKKEEHQTEVWTWLRRDIVEREFCTAINLKDLEPYKKDLITEVKSVVLQ